MIVSFSDSEAEKIWSRQASRKLPPDIQRTARRKLVALDAAMQLDDLKTPPGNHLEMLQGDREGQYSIRINDAWRICFVWQEGIVLDVEIVNYHRR